MDFLRNHKLVSQFHRCYIIFEMIDLSLIEDKALLTTGFLEQVFGSVRRVRHF